VNAILFEGEQDMFEIVFQKICTTMVCGGKLMNVENRMKNMGVKN
jgi:hypothetical protein